MRIFRMKSAAFTLFDGHLCITGEVTGDMSGDYPTGTYVRTSYLKSIDFERRIAVTQNSVYHFDKFENPITCY